MRTQQAQHPRARTGRRITAYARAVTFFYKHAGYGYDPARETRTQGKRRGARQLAKAEAWAEAEGLEYVWRLDDLFDPDDFDGEDQRAYAREHGAVYCVLYRPCPDHGVACRHAEVLGSLSGIVESLDNRERDAYRRVVQAELALEAMPKGDN